LAWDPELRFKAGWVAICIINSMEVYMKIDTYLVLLLSTLASLRMAIWLFIPSKHRGISIGLYDRRKVVAKRVVYFSLFLVLSVFLVLRVSIVNFMMAFFAIGSLYDFLFTFYEIPNIENLDYESVVREGKMPAKIPVLNRVRWFIGGPMILFTIWLWFYVLSS
jgi:hypothetical protein